MGNDFCTELISIATDANKRYGFDRFEDGVNEVIEIKIADARKRKNPKSRISLLEDKREALLVIRDGIAARNFEEFKLCLKDLFSDSEDGRTITLCTVHKAKGLEAERVHVLNYATMPLVFDGMNRAQMQQEMNIKYVALTRSKLYMSLVGSDK